MLSHASHNTPGCSAIANSTAGIYWLEEYDRKAANRLMNSSHIYGIVKYNTPEGHASHLGDTSQLVLAVINVRMRCQLLQWPVVLMGRYWDLAGSHGHYRQSQNTSNPIIIRIATYCHFHYHHFLSLVIISLYVIIISAEFISLVINNISLCILYHLHYHFLHCILATSNSRHSRSFHFGHFHIISRYYVLLYQSFQPSSLSPSPSLLLLRCLSAFVALLLKRHWIFRHCIEGQFSHCRLLFFQACHHTEWSSVRIGRLLFLSLASQPYLYSHLMPISFSSQPLFDAHHYEHIFE